MVQATFRGTRWRAAWRWSTARVAKASTATRSDGTWLGYLAQESVGAYAVGFTPDGEHVLVGFADGKLELRTLDGRTVSAFAGILNSIRNARISADGRFVAAADRDVLQVWTMAGDPWLRVEHPTLPHDLAFSPDGSQIAVACADGTIRIWPVTQERIEALAEYVFRELTPDERSTFLGGQRPERGVDRR